MSLTEALAVTQPHRAAELERARAGIEADVEWCRWRRKYGHVGTLAEAREATKDFFRSIDLPSEQQQTNNTTPATAKASATTTTE